MSKQQFLDQVANLINGLSPKELEMMSLVGLYDQILEHVVDHTRDDRDED